jgi:hypothetical protein
MYKLSITIDFAEPINDVDKVLNALREIANESGEVAVVEKAAAPKKKKATKKKATKKKADDSLPPPPVEEPPAPEVNENFKTDPTIDDVRQALKSYLGAKGEAGLPEIFADFNAENVSSLYPEQYGDLIARLELESK